MEFVRRKPLSWSDIVLAFKGKFSANWSGLTDFKSPTCDFTDNSRVRVSKNEK